MKSSALFISSLLISLNTWAMPTCRVTLNTDEQMNLACPIGANIPPLLVTISKSNFSNRISAHNFCQKYADNYTTLNDGLMDQLNFVIDIGDEARQLLSSLSAGSSHLDLDNDEAIYWNPNITTFNTTNKDVIIVRGGAQVKNEKITDAKTTFELPAICLSLTKTDYKNMTRNNP